MGVVNKTLWFFCIFPRGAIKCTCHMVEIHPRGSRQVGKVSAALQRFLHHQ